MATAYLDVACYYYEPEKIPLLRSAVLPAVRFAVAQGADAHVERHWRFGPHLRVRLAGTGESDLIGTAAAVADRLRRHLQANPSVTDIDEGALLAQARVAGQEELIPPPYTPLRPDNTVQQEPVDLSGLTQLLGSAAAVMCRMRLLRAGVPALGASAELLQQRGNSPANRVQLALTAMALHAGRYPPGFGGGYQSFLSHLKEFLLHHDGDGRLAAGYEAAWRRQADELTALVARLADASTRTPTERAWLEWTVGARALSYPADQRGELQRVPGYSYTDRARQLGDPDVALRWDPDRRTRFSDYHQLLRLTDLENFPHLDEFVPYRFNTSVLYLLLTILDLRPVERYLAAYLLSQAAERIVGVTWEERLRAKLAAAGTPVPAGFEPVRPSPGDGVSQGARR